MKMSDMIFRAEIEIAKKSKFHDELMFLVMEYRKYGNLTGVQVRALERMIK